MIDKFDFDKLSEADVREEIIAPVLRRLGYQSGTDNTILRERAIELRYPKMFLGRKKHAKDPVLRGRPDYVCEARNVTRWVIEAKSPGEEISQDDVEQAHSYAVHVELAAPIFVLCNGRKWLIYESNRGPASEPLVSLSHVDLIERFHVLSNLLSPEGLRRRYPLQTVDYDRPLATGFGSKAAIVGGFTKYDELHCIFDGLPQGAPTPDFSALQRYVGYRAAIIGDACLRNEELGIVAELRFHHPYDAMSAFAESVGIARCRYSTRSHSISDKSDAPTIFEYSTQFDINAGKEMFDFTTGSTSILPVPGRFSMHAEAIGHVNKNTFHGTYSSRMLFDFHFGPHAIQQCTFARGTYEIEFRDV
jgi:Type I restriction enzyme R protein N terminus (HSDR_N)